MHFKKEFNYIIKNRLNTKKNLMSSIANSKQKLNFSSKQLKKNSKISRLPLEKTKRAFKKPYYPWRKLFDKSFLVRKKHKRNYFSKLKRAVIKTNRPSLNLIILIKIFSHNIFLTLYQRNLFKIIKSISSGTYKLKVSQKKLKYYLDFIIKKFFLEIKSFIHRRNIIFLLSVPIRLKKKILGSIKKYCLKGHFIIKIKALKCFNGCRAKKKKRKKRSRSRFLKIV